MNFLYAVLFLIFPVQILAGTISSVDRQTLNKTYLYGNHLIVSSFRCGNTNDGIYFKVFNRNSYKLKNQLRY